MPGREGEGETGTGRRRKERTVEREREEGKKEVATLDPARKKI